MAFWAFYARGFTADNAVAITAFGAAYMLVIVIEPLADLAVLAVARTIHRLRGSAFLDTRLYDPA